jgi:hypothetical protein
LIILIDYFFAIIGLFFSGNYFNQVSINNLILIGLIILFLSFFSIRILKFFIKKNYNYINLSLSINKNYNVLTIVGISVIFFSILINIMALPDFWRADLYPLKNYVFNRSYFVPFIGFIFIISGILNRTNFELKKINNLNIFYSSKTILLLLWVLFSGTLIIINKNSRSPKFPVLINSQWQTLSKEIDTNNSVCVPINPLGWIYQRNCKIYSSNISWANQYYFNKLDKNEVIYFLTESSDLKVQSLSFLIEPDVKMSNISADLYLYLKNNSIIKIHKSDFYRKQSLLFFYFKDQISMNKIKYIKLVLSPNTRLGFEVKSKDIAIMWLLTNG